MRSMVYDESLKLYVLQETEAPKSTLLQRMGRVGRLNGGAVYRIITDREYQLRRPWSIPEVLNRPLTSTVLTLLEGGCFHMFEFFLDPPLPTKITGCLKELCDLGIILQSIHFIPPFPFPFHSRLYFFSLFFFFFLSSE